MLTHVPMAADIMHYVRNNSIGIQKIPTRLYGDLNFEGAYSAVLFDSSAIRAFLPNNLRK